MRTHRQTGPRDIYANLLLLFIDSRVPDKNHLLPRSDRRVAQFIVVIIIVDPPRLCSYKNLRHSNPLGKQQMSNKCTRARVCAYVGVYLHIYSVVHYETLTHI